jgi:proteasome lid subunit RPN8/RPN11
LGGGPLIEIPAAAVRTIEDHAREASPEECCGFLIGSGGKPRRVVEARRAKNVASENRTRRYQVDPLELLHADQAAREKGLDLIGIYHSHPNHPAAPSEFDRSHATSWFIYVILGVRDGEPQELTAWRFDESTQRFEAEEIRVQSGRAPSRRPQGEKRRAPRKERRGEP